MSLRQRAREIWEAGVAAVSSEELVRNAIRRDGSTLFLGDESWDLRTLGRILVLGVGKAGAGMAAAIEESLGASWLDAKVTGWVNVPEDCVRPLRKITLHGARPAGLNEPTEAGVFGTQRILELASRAGPNDLVIVLISGGGSALAPAPIEGVSLADKLAVTRFLMRSGATIQELNTVRKHLSLFKGGGLARAASRARAVVTLIISDVIGDPLDVIASGPTVEDTNTAADALAVLQRFNARPPVIPESVFAVLRNQLAHLLQQAALRNVRNRVIGNNDTAVQAAKRKAEQLGYVVVSTEHDVAGEARMIGEQIADECLHRREQISSSGDQSLCLISGGEPVVKLAVTNQPRRGGRNQEVALAALTRLWTRGLDGIAILSGGTDGEDGPTNAAGAVVDETLRQTAIAKRLDPAEFLAINNSYPFFEQTDGLLITGPTHTNVMDLRVALVDRTTSLARPASS